MQNQAPEAQEDGPLPHEAQEDVPPAHEAQEDGPLAQEAHGDPPPVQQNQGDPPPVQENLGDPPAVQENEANPPPIQGAEANHPPAEQAQGNPPPAQQVQENPALPVSFEAFVDSIYNTLPEALTEAGVPPFVSPVLSEAVAEVVRAAVVAAVSPMLVAARAPGDNVSVQQFRNIGVGALINTGIQAHVEDLPIPPRRSIWKIYPLELLSNLTLLNAGILSVLALSYPGETLSDRKNRALTFSFFTACFVILSGLRIAGERMKDGAEFWGLWYTARRNKLKIFYFKFLSQTFAIMIILCTFSLSITYLIKSLKEKKSHVTDKTKIDKESIQYLKYYIGLSGILFTTMTGIFQAHGSTRKTDIVVQNNEGSNLTLKRLEGVLDCPPDGRIDVVRLNQSYRPYQFNV